MFKERKSRKHEKSEFIENKIKNNLDELENNKMYASTEIKKNLDKEENMSNKVNEMAFGSSTRIKRRIMKSNLKQIKNQNQYNEANYLITCNISTKDNSPFLIAKSSA
jgi:hypothetical protein